MNQTKVRLRKTLLEARMALSIKARQQKTIAITEQVKNALDWGGIYKLHIYRSIEALGEVDTKPLIEFIESDYPGIKLYSPRKVNKIWQDVDAQGSPVGQIKYDVIIVPLLGFDNDLNRLGYGGGYYDKLLVSQEGANTVGLSFEVGHIGSIPKEPHDVRLKSVVSEEKVYL